MHHNYRQMDLRKANRFKVYIIESLHEGDMHTGQNLYDYLRQRSVDYSDYMFEATYLSVYDREELLETFREISNDVEANNDVPIVQIECHGDINYILLSSNEHIGWIELFDLTRPVNIVSHNSLLLNLSMCNGHAVIQEIDPKKRAPFRAVVGPFEEKKATSLQESWEKFYDRYYIGIKNNQEFWLHELASDCGLIYYNQEFIFDSHLDTPNLFPEIFDYWMKKEIADMYMKEGPLMLDSNAYKIYRARQFKKYFDEFRPYYCFQSDSHNNGRQVDHHE